MPETAATTFGLKCTTVKAGQTHTHKGLQNVDTGEDQNQVSIQASKQIQRGKGRIHNPTGKGPEDREKTTVKVGPRHTG